MYYFENNQLNIIKGDKMRIGGISPTFHFGNKVFETKLQNTKFYFATDGYTDQNNEKREKIGTHNLQKILENIANEDFRIQKQTLIAYLAEHQGREPQRDDISVICLQIN
jgi:serine phosphatase RsbU (regulator of sigma subunit)